MRAIVLTTSAIRNAPHSIRTATGRVEAVRRTGRAPPSGADIAEKPLSERAVRDMIPTTVERSGILGLNIWDQVKGDAGPMPERRSRLTCVLHRGISCG